MAELVQSVVEAQGAQGVSQGEKDVQQEGGRLIESTASTSAMFSTNRRKNVSKTLSTSTRSTNRGISRNFKGKSKAITRSNNQISEETEWVSDSDDSDDNISLRQLQKKTRERTQTNNVLVSEAGGSGGNTMTTSTATITTGNSELAMLIRLMEQMKEPD